MTIKGTTCEVVDISFEIKSNNNALATKMLLSECLFIQVINNIAPQYILSKYLFLLKFQPVSIFHSYLHPKALRMSMY